mmetsp:Transcript_38379/g.81361  ORF Transcript_38379/g.81361 Transcript_38379/m.81361 type:complete len:433 (-) Transcript_38379:171-1469(-)|eukprot:CAMPEP_0206458136 /NCGR_PEP_ID=MMETSP0324_2-20121206/23379_1 /ASSEMBLY_ACC=CAM_ASM_000836 /TAXON_ID=2866 /ORGANISM="Crypthecodinium cohnii, Strain Seligo" /LENGTH=432 /DNA_ID=CAMNT_0053929395 /DNA_START=31 /DNA_END=1329 /DNA_ORIENTATION=+
MADLEWSIPPEENPWAYDDLVDPTEQRLYDKLWTHEDPFRPSRNPIYIPDYREPSKDSAPGAALRSLDEEGEEDDQEEEEEEEEDPVEKARREREEDEERKRALLEELTGYELWMGGQNLRTRLLLPDEVEIYKQRAADIENAKSFARTKYPVDLGGSPYNHWFRVEDPAAMPTPSASSSSSSSSSLRHRLRRTSSVTAFFEEDLHDLQGVQCDSDINDIRMASLLLHEKLKDHQTQVPQCFCWRGDFVHEAKLAAKGQGMRQVSAVEQPSTTDRMVFLEGYTPASCSAGGREVWSRGFLTLLEALHARWGLHVEQNPDKRVKMSEEELSSRRPDLHFPPPRRMPDLKPQTVHIPRSLKTTLLARGPPPIPAIPVRLHSQPCYKEDKRWGGMPRLPGEFGFLPERVEEDRGSDHAAPFQSLGRRLVTGSRFG